MKITKQQRAARDKAVQQAGAAAVRRYFTGEGSKARSAQFLWGWLYVSCVWFAMLLCFSSWAVVAGLLVGPEHQQFMVMFRDWMVATPIDVVLSQSQEYVAMLSVELAKLALVAGLVQKFLTLIAPAVQEAKNSFKQSLV